MGAGTSRSLKVLDWGFLKGLLTAFQKAENIALIFRHLSPPVFASTVAGAREYLLRLRPRTFLSVC
jgi:hypothetical protein